jgi:hypothetical protein
MGGGGRVCESAVKRLSDPDPLPLSLQVPEEGGSQGPPASTRKRHRSSEAVAAGRSPLGQLPSQQGGAEEGGLLPPLVMDWELPSQQEGGGAAAASPAPSAARPQPSPCDSGLGLGSQMQLGNKGRAQKLERLSSSFASSTPEPAPSLPRSPLPPSPPGSRGGGSPLGAVSPPEGQ